MKRRAGRRARDKYKALRKAWLRENRKPFAALAVGGIGVAAAFHAVMLWWPGDHTWVSGFFTGALATSWFAFRQTPPAVIENWQQGAWGEEFTAAELGKLPSEDWVVINDLPNGPYNFDHVVIGPAGVFCLNSKKTSSRLQVAPGGGRLLLTNRFDDAVSYEDTRMLRQARSDASELGKRIYQRTGQRVWVQPVIVWWGEFPDRRRWHARVGLVHGQEVVDWLGRQPMDPPTDIPAIAAGIMPGRRRGRSALFSRLGS
jgi:hypothetical protein